MYMYIICMYMICHIAHAHIYIFPINWRMQRVDQTPAWNDSGTSLSNWLRFCGWVAFHPHLPETARIYGLRWDASTCPWRFGQRDKLEEDCLGCQAYREPGVASWKKYGGNTSWTCAHAIIYITCTGTKIETINPFIILVHISCTLCVTSMIFALSTQRHQIQYLISGEGLPDPRPAAWEAAEKEDYGGQGWQG